MTQAVLATMTSKMRRPCWRIRSGYSVTTSMAGTKNSSISAISQLVPACSQPGLMTPEKSPMASSAKPIRPAGMLQPKWARKASMATQIALRMAICTAALAP